MQIHPSYLLGLVIVLAVLYFLKHEWDIHHEAPPDDTIVDYRGKAMTADMRDAIQFLEYENTIPISNAFPNFDAQGMRIVYQDESNNCLCGMCALRGYPDVPLTGYFEYAYGAPIVCGCCQKDITASFGEEDA